MSLLQAARGQADAPHVLGALSNPLAEALNGSAESGEYVDVCGRAVSMNDLVECDGNSSDNGQELRESFGKVVRDESRGGDNVDTFQNR